MAYNIKLFWQMTVRSFVNTAHTHGQLKTKRVLFLMLFYTVWIPHTMWTWFCFLLDDIFFPAYKTHPVEKPLFILGNFRSGSTFLHRLLSRDVGNFTSLRTWDIFITPSVTQRKLAALLARLDRLVGSPIRRALRAIDARGLGKVRIHKISLFDPEEDENILLHIWSTFFVSFMFPFLDTLPPYQFFDDALPAKDRQRIMGFYRSMLQRHLYATGARHFVAKNPAFSAKIATLKEFFPEARIIYLVRNPLDMLPSTISWLTYAWGVFSVLQERYPYRSEILELTQYWYRHPLDWLDANPSPNHLILKYDDLISNPEPILRAFYRQFGYAEVPGLNKIVAQAVEETNQYQSDHAYSYEEMGYTRPEIVTAFKDIFERFGFDERAPVLHPASVNQSTPAAD
jgi:omega-hydroxy-beta-dihydromenaquinone-9 sulfotransferase